MNKIKVLMLGWELPPFVSGGLATASYYLANSLAGRVELTFTLPDDLPVFVPGVEIVTLKTRLRRYPAYVSFYLDYPLLVLQGILQKVFDYAESALNYFSDPFDFDIIHAHDYLTFFAGFALKQRYKKPLVVHIHSTEIDRTGNNPNPDIYRLEKFALDNADKVLAVSDYEKSIIKEYYGVAAEKIAVVPHGLPNVSAAEQEIRLIKNLRQEGHQFVLLVGRITLQKGPDYLLRAAPWVLRFLPKTRFIFVGDGDMLPQLIKMSFDLGVNKQVIFTGFLDRDHVDLLYKQADLFVMPSVSEPFGLVALEAAVHGLPLILSRTSGVSQYLQNKLEVDFWDVRELANKIVGTLKYPELAHELSRNARRDLEKLDWRKSADKIVGIYQELLSLPS